MTNIPDTKIHVLNSLKQLEKEFENFKAILGSTIYTLEHDSDVTARLDLLKDINQPIGVLFEYSIGLDETKFTKSNFSVLARVLTNENIKTLKDLLDYKSRDLLLLPGFGYKSLELLEYLWERAGHQILNKDNKAKWTHTFIW